MQRKFKDFLTAYLKYTENSEPPISYHTWTGLSLLAGALERKVYMKWGNLIIYPNLYVVLVGPAGRTKKGTAMSFGRSLLEGVKVKTVSGSITREALIRRMASNVESYQDQTTGQIRFQCAITCFSEELSVFLGHHDIKFIATLCDWYDCPTLWKYDTKNQGTDSIDGVCFNLIAASAPEWITEILPPVAIGGGFTRRVVWVVEENKRGTVLYPTTDPQLEQALVHDLEQIKMLTGEFTFSPQAQKRYEQWYQIEDQKIAEGRPPIMDPRFAGYCEARATLIKKVGMSISVSEGNTLIISEGQFERALTMMESAERKMSRAFAGLGAARYAKATELLLGFIISRKKVTRSQVLRSFFRDIDDYTFKVCIDTLESMKVVRTELLKDTNDLLVELIDASSLGEFTCH